MAARSVVSIIKNLYNDPFQWQIVKSVVLFGIGVYVAREVSHVDLNAPA